MSQSQSRRAEPERQTVQIARLSYTALYELIRQPLLLRIDRLPQGQDPLTGVRSLHSYRLADPTEFQLLDDTTARIGPVEIQAAFTHLPSPAYRALTQASDAFRQYVGLPELLAAARTPGQTPAQVRRLIEAAVQQGRQPGQPGLYVPSQQFQSEWLADEILVHQTETEFFISLAFRTRFQRLSRARVTNRVGLDLGLDPLSVAAHENGALHTFRPTALAIPALNSLTPEGRQLLNQLLYASGRQDAERILAYLTHHAHHVYAEHLTHRGMSLRFVQRARVQAVHDFHFSWISQSLNVAGIGFTRVDPAGTSTTCPQPDCRHRHADNRRGRAFLCRACGYQGDADAVAAHNIVNWGIHGRP
ncbi:zinc ribbon domain-containing protein [Deinococcus sp. ME38]|uniref:zinc ribbon domain-containing protein n=1 Tax=Deinococcus sp. ME38 TaxID=3400344 RepID=UPI003B5B6372